MLLRGYYTYLFGYNNPKGVSASVMEVLYGRIRRLYVNLSRNIIDQLLDNINQKHTQLLNTRLLLINMCYVV